MGSMVKAAKELDHCAVAEIIPTAPFYFDATVYKPDHFPSSDTRWESGKRWQTMHWLGQDLGLLLENAGDTEIPSIILRVYSEEPLPLPLMDSVSNEVQYRFNLKLDLGRFYASFREDQQLSPILRRFRGLRPMNAGSLYEYLVFAIVLQNATVRRSISMMQALFEKYGTLLRFGDQELYCFWEARALAQASEKELRELKVGYRAKSLIKVSQAFAEGRIDELALRGKCREEQRDALLSLYGVGPASVGYIMFDVLHHWDYLAYIPPWEQKIYTKVFFHRDYLSDLVPVGEMLEYFEQRFGRYKALAVHYFWQDLWWKRRNERIPWLEELIRL
jgi:3-methyladenine DNA glycosylase/8-oxoguanine DNA glycosylase